MLFGGEREGKRGEIEKKLVNFNEQKKCKMGISGAIKLSQFASASHLHRCAVMLLCLHPSRKTFQLKDCLADERKKKTKQQNKYLLEMFLESFSSFLRNLSAEENSFDGGESSAGGGSREMSRCAAKRLTEHPHDAGV